MNKDGWAKTGAAAKMSHESPNKLARRIDQFGLHFVFKNLKDKKNAVHWQHFLK
jgi:hypothetical protein